MFEFCECMKKSYICNVAFATNIEDVERRFALKRRNLVNFNTIEEQSFRRSIPVRAWTAFMILLLRFTRAFLSEYKSQATLFLCARASDRGSRKTGRVGRKTSILNGKRKEILPSINF